MRHLLRAIAVCLLLPPAAGADPAPALNLEPSSTTVSGLSSGAFMAVQLQVAFSERISGAGIVAGGPYGCADGSVYRALWRCMETYFGDADAEASVRMIGEASAEGGIDDPGGLQPDRIYLFHGAEDETVDRASMDALRESYAALGVPEGRVVYETGVPAGHGFVTESGPLDCGATAPDFLVDCDFDLAGGILSHLYPGLAPAAEPREAHLLAFDQSLYLEGAQGMDETAFVYVPQACGDGAACRLHIALHGCRQGREVMGEDFARLAGFNRWAEANDIVVLYPQARSIPSPWWNWVGGNPKGCWDWWGYSGGDYLTRDAPQIAAIARMAAALGVDLDG